MKQNKIIEKYQHQEIEAKWRKTWSDTKIDTLDVAKAKKPFYNLMMFPYPSAEGLHVGNMYAFTGADIYGRFKRMQGYDVFEPIGLDGFGIHSENYAFKVGRHPIEQAKRSEQNFYRQLASVGCMYDWSRTIETYDPTYYRWTQWLFVQMFKHNLAYRAKAEVNWCPSCKTVLADEQVIEGSCERCGNLVEKRALKQWFFRITAYAGKLLENISSLPAQAGLNWSPKVLIAQKNWIGKKEGINITYSVFDEKGNTFDTLTCFTTRPDTNYGATFVVIAPEHPFVTRILSVTKKKQADAIVRYVVTARNTTQQDRIAQGQKKTGIATEFYAKNQLTGRKMPIYISDFVVMSVGTGAVVGVPGHDVRDFEFAIAMHIPILRVVIGPDGDTSEITKVEQVQEDEGIMVHSDFLDGMQIHVAKETMMDHLIKNEWAERVTTYHLRDWLISRQRYWGPPIPMIHCDNCEKNNKGERVDMPGWYSVALKDLPVLLPYIEDYKPGNDGVAPLAKHKEFYETTCPGCGKKANRETDVSDTFLDSSWYFLRYPSIRSEHNVLPWDPEITKKWLPVDMYTGGAEHSVLHLMYSRFVTMALKDWGYLGFEEPFPNFYAHGLVIKEGVKMSKSKGNVVNPDEYIKLYGTDALRMYLMFMGPFSEGGDFRDTGMEGMARWVGRIWRMVIGSLEAGTDIVVSDKITKTLHKTIKKVGEDTDRRHYNTAIAAMMELTNLVSLENGTLSRSMLKMFLIILAPYAPYLADELWERLGGEYSIHTQHWPLFDASLLEEDMVSIVVQVNGKFRDTIDIDTVSASNQKKIEIIVRDSEKIQKFLRGKKEKKTIFIPCRLINFVV